MVVVAHIETGSGELEQSGRVRLGLHTAAIASKAEVLVHNISATGLVLEGDVRLSLNDDFDVAFPHGGAAAATVAWVSQRLRGCMFKTPVSDATLDAAMLRDAAVPAQTGVQSGGESFGLRLHQFRLAKGLTQSQLARQLKVSEPSISHWETDKSRPKAGRMQMLAVILGVPMPELLGYDDAETLRKLVDRAKEEIARAAGADVNNVRITIDM